MTGPRKAYLNQATQQCTIDQTPLWPDAPNTPFPGEFGFARTIEAPLVLKVDTSFSEEKIADAYNDDDIDDDGPKCPYKDFDLIFVAQCDDSAIGNGALLKLTVEQSQALRREELELEKLVKSFANNADKGREEIAKEVLKLAPLHDSKGGEVITEIWRMRGEKRTYVRSSKLKNHVKKYDIDIDKIKKDSSLFEKKRISYIDSKGNSKTVETRVLNKEKIKEMFLPKIKLAIKAETSGSIQKLFSDSIEKWVDKQNESLKGSARREGDVFGRKIEWDYNYGAQFARYLASAGAEAEFDLTKLKINAKAEGKAEIALAEGKVSSTVYVPSRTGWHARITVESTVLDFGYFRGQLTFEASGMVGASIIGAAQVGLNYNKSKGRMEIVPVEPSANIKVSGAEASVKAFAGIEVGGKVTGAGMWKNPEANNEYKELLAIGVGLNGGLGIGGEIKFFITYENGRLMFRAKASLVLGWGGGGDIAGSIGFGAIIDFVQFLYHQLNNNNFNFLYFISKEAFELHIAITIYLIDRGRATVRWTENKLEEVYLKFKSNNLLRINAENLANNILSDSSFLRFTSPEAKGILLYKLSETFVFSREEGQEEAILEVLSWCQTSSEFHKTVSRVNPQGKRVGYSAGKSRLDDILDFKEQRLFDKAIKDPEKFVANNIHKHGFLYDGLFLNQPNPMNPIEKRSLLT